MGQVYKIVFVPLSILQTVVPKCIFTPFIETSKVLQVEDFALFL